MTLELNKIACTSDYGNTGVGACYLEPKNIIGAILVDPSWVYDSTKVANLLLNFQTDVLAVGKTRIYPIFTFGEIADNSEDVAITTMGYGTKKVAKEGKYDWTFKLTKGGVCLLNQLRKFNNRNMKVLFVDADNVIYGTQTTVVGEITGFSMEFFYAYPFKLNDGSNTSQYMVRFALSKPAEFNENISFIASDFDVEENVKGNLSLMLVDTGVYDVDIATIKVYGGCDKQDMYDVFSAELADAAVWKATLKSDGSNVVIANVALEQTLKAFEVVTASVVGEVIFELRTANVLASNGIGGAPDNGFEGINTLTIDMPAS